MFFKACHHPGGSFIYRAHVTYLTCKANVSLTWNNIARTNHKRKGRFLAKIPQLKSLLEPRFVPANFLHRPTLLWSRTFLAGSGHFHGSVFCLLRLLRPGLGDKMPRWLYDLIQMRRDGSKFYVIWKFIRVPLFQRKHSLMSWLTHSLSLSLSPILI